MGAVNLGETWYEIVIIHWRVPKRAHGVLAGERAMLEAAVGAGHATLVLEDGREVAIIARLVDPAADRLFFVVNGPVPGC